VATITAADDFEVAEVQAALTDDGGAELESGAAAETPADSGRWVYTATTAVALGTMVRIAVAALAGGIGVNRARPTEFFYKNLMMGTQLLHESYEASVEKFVGIGVVCAYPKFVQGRGPVERLSGGDQRPLRPGQEDDAGAEPDLPGAIRL
jgi:nucleoside-diphosphate-sugar epimerase